MISSVLGWIVFGLVVGVVARFLIPGQQPMGIIMTILLGVAGSFAGGCIASLVRGGKLPTELVPSDFLWSLLGAVLLLLGYAWLQKRR
jgi:uncharacterized membrane protein YeaQ/YmgE (transglycosylase-associated protein family)